MILPKNDRHADLPYVSLSDYAEANFIAAPKGFMLRAGSLLQKGGLYAAGGDGER